MKDQTDEVLDPSQGSQRSREQGISRAAKMGNWKKRHGLYSVKPPTTQRVAALQALLYIEWAVNAALPVISFYMMDTLHYWALGDSGEAHLIRCCVQPSEVPFPPSDGSTLLAFQLFKKLMMCVLLLCHL